MKLRPGPMLKDFRQQWLLQIDFNYFNIRGSDSELPGLKFLSALGEKDDLEEVPDSEFIGVVGIPFPFPKRFYFDLE